MCIKKKQREIFRSPSTNFPIKLLHDGLFCEILFSFDKTLTHNLIVVTMALKKKLTQHDRLREAILTYHTTLRDHTYTHGHDI